MLKVAKFGGSSMADAAQIRKVCAIIRADEARKLIVVSAAGKSRDGVSDGCGTGSDGESGNATFEGSDTFFENALGRIGDAAVDVTGVLQGETVSGMLSAMEHVGSGLVDGNCARIGCGICMFLANVNLESFKMELVLCRHG